MNQSYGASPLSQRIQKILLECRGEPLSLLEIHAQLRRQGNGSVATDVLRSILEDRTLFTVLSDDRYIMRDHLAVPKIDSAQPSTSLYLQNLSAASSDYVVLDIETSGTNLETDSIIQIAAMRVRNCQPVLFRNWYVYCDPIGLTPSLRRAIHLTDEIVARIKEAPPIDDIWTEVRDFLAADALVIHNARFDMGFLMRQDPLLSNVALDTMELALLAMPDAAVYKLSSLAETLGIDIALLSTRGIAGIPAGYQPSVDSLHNAITDVLLLQAVYASLCDRLQTLPHAVQALYAFLLPGIGVSDTGASAQLLAALSTDQNHDSHTIMTPLQDTHSLALLDRFAADQQLVPRAAQRNMVELIDGALTDDRSLLIEAPTGTGKTLAYLMPTVWHALHAGRRIAIATAYKNLQDQLRAEVTRLQHFIGFRAQMLKGSASYLCLRNLQDAIEEIGPETQIDRRFALASIAGRIAADQTMTLDELPFWLRSTVPVTTDIVREVAVDRATCTERQCPFYDTCGLFAAYRRAAQADVLLINQALWLHEPTAMPAFDSIIIDEAHNLEDTATSTFEQEVSEITIRSQLLRLAVPGAHRGVLNRVLKSKTDEVLRGEIHAVRQKIGQVLRLVEDLRGTLTAFVKTCDERLDPKKGAQLQLVGAPARVYPTRWRVVQQALDQIWEVYLTPMIDSLQRIAYQLADGHVVEVRTIEAVRSSLIEQRTLLQAILQAQKTNLVTWIAVEHDDETLRGKWGFHAAPILVAPLLAERYKPYRSVILTSATLTTGKNDFSFFVDRLGLHEILGDNGAHTLPPVLPYSTNVLLGIPTYLTYTPAQETIKSFIEEIAQEFGLLFRYTDGRALVLFTSRERLEKVNAHSEPLLEPHGVPLLAQLSGANRQRLVDDFKSHGGAVLFGLKAFWEGVDIPGEMLSFVVMEKLPYPALTDPVHTARRKAVHEQSGHEFEDYLFPLMVIQFKQGFGRLLRREDDRGAVIIYDRRVARKSYLPQMLDSLPGYQPRDPVAERTRRAFYELLDQRLPGLIDSTAKESLLAELPDILATNLEALVERLAIPDPLSLEDYETYRPRILEALKALFRHNDFRSPTQEAAVKSMLTGSDVLAILPTGAGKSLCFQLPALLRRGLTIVCSPLIALMRDQIDKLHEQGIEIAAALISGQSASEREEIMGRVRAGKIRLLYIAPERLRDPVLRNLLLDTTVRQIVVDEAHCVALWGPSFRPDFLVIPQIYADLEQRPPVAAFTATATPIIEQEITKSLALHDPTIVRTSIDRPELQLVVLDREAPYHPITSKTDKIRRLMMLVQTATQRDELMLIYTATTTEAEHLARLLNVAGFLARAYHGKMPIQERANISEQFMDGLLSIVVCTKAFGMGVDKANVRYVVHYHMPGDLESYFQEVGRAGRDGASAYAILLYHKSDEQIQRYFIEKSRPDGELLARLWREVCSQPAFFILDPIVICDAFDIDELELRRALYLLERAELIQRGHDVTLRGNLTLLGTWDEVLSLVDGNDHTLIEYLRTLLPEAGWSRVSLELKDIASNLGCDVEALEQTLVRFSIAGGCLYRPWERGYQVRRIVDATTPLPAVGHETADAQEAKLRQIRAFVRQRGCRWQALRAYFGEPLGAPCGRCERCDPHQRYPWSGVTERDVPDVSEIINLDTTWLGIIDWNERRAREGRSHYSRLSLLRILRGDEYALMRGLEPGPASRYRRDELRSCPYWGVCRTLRRSTSDLEQRLQRLFDSSFIEQRTASFGSNGTYVYLILTDRGRTQLQSGEHIQWG